MGVMRKPKVHASTERPFLPFSRFRPDPELLVRQIKRWLEGRPASIRTRALSNIIRPTDERR